MLFARADAVVHDERQSRQHQQRDGNQRHPLAGGHAVEEFAELSERAAEGFHVDRWPVVCVRWSVIADVPSPFGEG